MSNQDEQLQLFEKKLQDTMNTLDVPAERIRNATLYSLFPGGKRLRPRLVYLCGELISAPPRALDSIAIAVELIHAYSLVHDDLPAMDNDDMRRGKPSCHRAFDEATAILVGDGLQALAIDVLLSQLPPVLPLPKVLAITHELVKACGPSGMISGQSLDLSELTNGHVDEALLAKIHDLKTSRLMLACINMVLLTVDPSQNVIQSLRSFATHFGLAFQMQDDYLDAYGPTEGLGKNRASDFANNKSTFASYHTEKALRKMVETHFKQTESALTIFGPKAAALRLFLNTLLERSSGTVIFRV